MNTMVNAALDLAERGTPVFPCLEKDFGEKIAKSPYVDLSKASIDFNTIQKWWDRYPKAIIGVPTGQASGLTVLDLSSYSNNGTNGIETWENITKEFEYSPYQTKQIQSPSGGVHLYYNYNNKMKTGTNKISNGINTFGDDGYIIVPPSKLSGGSYNIINELLLRDVPPFISDIYTNRILEKELDISIYSSSEKSIRNILKEISPNCDYENWRRVGLSLFNWNLDKGFDLWRRWSNKTDASSCRRLWTTFDECKEVETLEYIIKLALKANARFSPTLNHASSVVQSRTKINYKEVGITFLENNWTFDDGVYTLKKWNSKFYGYNEGKYIEVNEGDLKAEVMSYLQDTEINPTSVMIKEVITNMDSNKYVHVSSNKRPPCLLSSNKELSSHRWINFDNGFLDLTEYRESGTINISEHSPDFFSLTKIPYNLDEKAECPEWESAMDLYLDGNKELIRLVQMIFGYCLTPSRKYNIIVFFHGGGGTAKSTLLEVLSKIIGKENTGSLNLNEISGRFSKVDLTTKLINVTSESAVNGDMRIDEAVIKTMTDGSAIYVEEKNKQGYSADVTAQLLIAANTLPTFSDKTSGMWRRLVIIPFNKVLSGTSDVKKDFSSYIIEKEAPGIIMWMLKGARMLSNYKEFPIPDKAKKLVVELRQESDEERTFLLSYYEEVEGSIVFCNDIYDKYKENTHVQDNSYIIGSRRFQNIVKTTFVNAYRSEKRVYRKGKLLSYTFKNLRLKNELTIESENCNEDC